MRPRQQANGLTYSRFVDDITISGRFGLQSSGFVGLVGRILGEHGFKIHPAKYEFGRLKDGCSVTGLRVRDGKLDVKKEYIDEVERRIEDASSLARGEEFQGPFLTANQLRGKVQFVLWVNPGRRVLPRKLNSIQWSRHREEAIRRHLVGMKKRLVPKSEYVRVLDTAQVN